MTTTKPDVASHYARAGLLERLDDALRADGIDPARPTLEALAPYDQFHGRGLEATLEAAARMQAGPDDHLLDVGSGLGGPARQIAHRWGCRVTGIDLTAAFCTVARELTRRLAMSQRVDFVTGDALAMPFADATFDGAYTMNVSMNIADRVALYREMHRVLRPGAWLLLSELARGEGPPPAYPTPWAESATSSHLATPQATVADLRAVGFHVPRWDSTLAQALAFNARVRAMIERGEKSPHRAVALIHGAEAAGAMGRRTGRALAEGGLVPIEVWARRPSSHEAANAPAARR